MQHIHLAEGLQFSCNLQQLQVVLSEYVCVSSA